MQAATERELMSSARYSGKERRVDLRDDFLRALASTPVGARISDWRGGQSAALGASMLSDPLQQLCRPIRAQHLRIRVSKALSGTPNCCTKRSDR